MKINYCSTVFLSLFIIFSCSKEDSQEENIPANCIEMGNGTKIMPLGASRVAGLKPIFESFRYELWKILIDSGYTFDFVGTVNDTGNYAEYKNYCFDNNHEGRLTATIVYINDNISAWLSELEMTDIVIFSSPGANDARNGASIYEIASILIEIIEKIQSHNPDVTILIEKMAPAKSSYMTAELKEALVQMVPIFDQIAVDKTTSKSKVIAVDMVTGFNDNLLADDLHYNLAGAKFIAQRHYNALTPFLN